MDKCLSEHAALTSDLSEWQTKNPNKIYCNDQSVMEDGRLILNLSINDTKFRLLCPANYPNHEDTFFMETECTDFWCIALNEFIIDSPEKLTLDVILTKAFLYYTPSSKKSDESSENDSDNEMENYASSSEDSDSSNTDEWKSIISKKKLEWRAKESELRLKYNRPKISDMFDGKIMDHPQQVFSNSAASEILINDLTNIMGSKDSSGIIVDPIENNICRWSVIFENFRPCSRMNKDLYETKKLYGYDNVQLQLEFTMDLYPSHPPIIQFIRPKLIHVFDRKDFVKLANWNPARDMMSVLKEIKDYIDRNGAVDINNECNGVKLIEVEKILIELKDALKVETKSISDTVSIYSLSESATRKLEESSFLEKCFAGSQHSSSISTGFNSRGSLEALKERNAVIETILTEFLHCIQNTVDKNSSKKCLKSSSPAMDSYFTFNLALNNNLFDEKKYESTLSGTQSYSSSTFKAINRLVENEKLETQSRYANHQKIDSPCNKNHCNITTNPSFELGSQSRDTAGLQNKKFALNNICIHDTKGTGRYVDRNSRYCSSGSEQRNKTDSQRVNDTVVSSFNVNTKTVQALSATASNNSTLELNDNNSHVFKILEESVLLPFIRSKLVVDGFFEIWLTTSLYSKIINILIVLASNPHLIGLLTISDIPDLIKTLEKSVTLILEMLTDIADENLMKQVDLDKAELAASIIEASKLTESKLTKDWNRKLSDQVFLDSKLSPDGGLVGSLDSIYKVSLKDLQFCNYNIDLENHIFKNEYIADINSSRNYFRIAQEFCVLSKSLPLEPTSAIFVRIDNSKCSLMRAMITGAEGTCCSGGCFTFDIYLRKDYPDDRLEISCTTFVDDEMTWVPKDSMISLSFGDESYPDHDSRSQISTILQVLTFIQRQKLPSNLYDKNCKNKDLEESRVEEILLSNVIQCAMINQMRKPTPGFEDVIATHFRIKRDRILAELQQYDFLKNSQLLDSLEKEFDRFTHSSQNL